MSKNNEPNPSNVPSNKNHPPYTGPRGPSPVRHGGHHMQKNYEMTEEEKRILRECQSESFWYRAMPLAVGAGLCAQALITRGTLSTSSRLGSIPKIGFACLFGYMAGKISYVTTCKEKFLKLESSPIGEMLRKGGRIPKVQGGNFGLPGFSPASIGDSDPSDPTITTNSDSYSGFGQSDDYHANLDIDTSNNSKDIDSQFDFELSNEAASALKAKRPEMTKTYEDLRRENRQQHQPRQSPRPSTQDDKAPGRSDKLPFSSSSRPRFVKNEYGDDME